MREELALDECHSSSSKYYRTYLRVGADTFNFLRFDAGWFESAASSVVVRLRGTGLQFSIASGASSAT